MLLILYQWLGIFGTENDRSLPMPQLDRGIPVFLQDIFDNRSIGAT
jgi:hypothetical protein